MTDLKGAKVTILAIDDEREVLDSICRVLSQAGYECHAAENAEQARGLVSRITPDLIVADINLAGRSGVTLCEELKRQPDLGEVPVMYLSSAQVPDIIRRSHAAGGTYYLRKPFDTQVLVQLSEKALRVPHLTSA